jgi:hypothetical protein
MKEIKLGGKKGAGMVALVDDEEFERVNKYKWRLDINGKNKYALSNIYINNKKTTIRLHRFIFNLNKNIKCIDHINHNGLDCRKINLRVCSYSQNQGNRMPTIGCTSKFKGVYWDKSRNKWLCEITPNKKKKHIGRFENEIDAAKAYDEKAREVYGEFAYTNFNIGR